MSQVPRRFAAGKSVSTQSGRKRQEWRKQAESVTRIQAASKSGSDGEVGSGAGRRTQRREPPKSEV